MKIKVLIGYDAQWEMSQTFNHSSISFFDPDMMGQRTLLVAYNDNVVVGIAAIVEKTVWYPNALGIGYISTHDDHRNIGVATALVTALFDYAKKSCKHISNTPYEPDGERYLKHVMHRISNNYPSVTLYERN
jgi:GNAT superfamily N-acetyltransferase